MDTKEKVLKSPLLKKKVTIALIKRSQSSLHQDENIGTLVTGGEKSFMTPVDSRGNIVNPLTQSERDYFEDLRLSDCPGRF